MLPFRLWWKVTQEADIAIARDHGFPASADAEECTLGGRSAGEDPRLLCLPERQFVTQAPAVGGTGCARAPEVSREQGGLEVGTGAGCWSSASLRKHACTQRRCKSGAAHSDLRPREDMCSAEAIPRLHSAQVLSNTACMPVPRTELRGQLRARSAEPEERDRAG